MLPSFAFNGYRFGRHLSRVIDFVSKHSSCDQSVVSHSEHWGEHFSITIGLIFHRDASFHALTGINRGPYGPRRVSRRRPRANNMEAIAGEVPQESLSHLAERQEFSVQTLVLIMVSPFMSF